MTIAGQVDCVAEYNGKLSTIDLKLPIKKDKRVGLITISYKTTAYAQMYEETFGKNIDQIVILLASEDGSMKTLLKKKDYMQPLMKSIDEFYKYYQG